MSDSLWLKCCQCGKQFQIAGKLAADTREFYARQPNHTKDREGGVCDACWLSTTGRDERIEPAPDQFPISDCPPNHSSVFVTKVKSNEMFSFVAPWTHVGEHADNLENELRKEITYGHPLFSLRTRPIARRTDSDEVLFEVDSPDFRYAVVQLSWTGSPERDCRWPHTKMFETFDIWVESRMTPDSQ